MVYSLFYCSLLLALFPLFCSSTTRSLPHHHSLHATLSRSAGSSKSRSLSHHYTLLVTLSRSAGSFNPRSSSRHYMLLATLSRSAGSFTTCSLLRHHSLLATLPRSKIPLNTPCFVTRNIMAEGAKKHDDFRLPT